MPKPKHHTVTVRYAVTLARPLLGNAVSADTIRFTVNGCGPSARAARADARRQIRHVRSSLTIQMEELTEPPNRE